LPGVVVIGTTTVRVALALPLGMRVTFCLSREASKRNLDVESRMRPLSPPTLVNVTPVEPLAPAASVMVPELNEIVKSEPAGPNGTTPVGKETDGAKMAASIIGTKHARKAIRIAENFLDSKWDTKTANSWDDRPKTPTVT